MLLHGPHFRDHRPWCIAFLVGTVVAVAAFVWVGALQDGWPGGGTRLGLIYGTIAALIFVFECLLVLRKSTRVRIGPPVRVWMRAHIWLGLLCVPLVILHAGGMRLAGGWLPLGLQVVFFVVIASGIWGLYLQNRVPTQITEEVPGETIARQIDDVMRLHTEQLAWLIDDVCGLPNQGELAAAVVGYRTPALRQFGRVRGKTESARPPAAEVPGAEPLRQFFIEVAQGYLLRGKEVPSPLASPLEADARFRRLRADVPPAAHPVVAELEGLCARRRELDRQKELDARLQRWRWVHIPLSALLVILTAIHIVTAIRYW